MDPDDFSVSFTLESREELALCGREFYDPPKPFVDAFDVWSFLVMQSTPPELLSRELEAIDTDWEALVARRRPRGDLDRRRQGDIERRARLRDEFRRRRDLGG
jgi:hypothetical protein